MEVHMSWWGSIELIGLDDNSPILEMAPLESQLYLMSHDILGEI